MILRITGVKQVRSKGRTYFYHRKTNTRLPGTPGSPEFLATLTRLNALGARAHVHSRTLGGLMQAYRASGEFAALAPATRQHYERAFGMLSPNADVPLADVTRKALYVLRDKINAAHKRSAANHVIKVLRLLFAWGMKRDLCDENPAAGVDKIRRPRGAPVVNRPWSFAELDTVLAEAPSHLRVPIALAAYTGLREADLVRVNWACYDGRTFQARARKTGTPIWVPVHKRLRAVLDAVPHDTATIVTGKLGGPVAQSTLRDGVFGLLRELREAGRVGPGLSIHGLRHTLGTALAEAGCDPATIAAVLGQATTQMAEHYSRSANRKRLAADAMRKLEDQDRAQPENDLANETENPPQASEIA